MKLMNHLVMIALIFAASTSFAKSTNDFQTKIVGGVEATAGEFPFIVSLHGSFGGHFCGASLIKKNWVLTAAHCVKGSSIKNVVIGLHDQRNASKAENIRPKRVIPHPQYDDNNADFDFALIELSKDSQFEPIAINTTEIAIPTGSDQIMATVAGWGVMKEDSYSTPSRLQKVDVPLVPHDVCNQNYKNAITDRMLCAGYSQGGKDSCQGDSGGPLVAKDVTGQNILIGVVSWGNGCARAGQPGVYAKVNEATTWIEQTAR
ncbi:S1 family serine peptidase [Bdellovibrio sp. HCB-110]|uniref:S1 family serine peptidase n=1 Tax=Bdellovibrio sp. HCB-110 TaxID=3391182 RepID=UPI0039B4143E